MIAPETDPSYAKIDEYVKHQEAVQMIFTLSGFMNYNIVKEMLDKNGIDINEKNYNGLTLLYAAIFSKNDSLLTGLIKDGADLYVTAYYMTFYKVVPLHMAVFTLNEFAVDELVKAGVSLNYKAEGIEEPAVMAVRLGLSKAVKLLMDRGVDFTTLMIPMANTGPIPALKFATDRKLTEIVALIEGQKK
jgi:ankyrin repeat protein